MNFNLFSFSNLVYGDVDHRGLVIRTTTSDIDLSRKDTWPRAVISIHGAWRTAVQIEQLLESGLANLENQEVVLPFDHFDEVEEESIDVTSAWTSPSPFLLQIDRFSDLGRPDFQYRYRFLEEHRQTALERIGFYVRRVASQTVFRLDSQMYALVEAMDRFNSLPAESKTMQETWLTFAKVKGCAGNVGALLDSTLSQVDVVVPSSLGLDIQEDDDGTLTFLPKCSELSPAEFHRVFERNSQAEGLYSLDRPGGGRVRIVLSDDQREVLKRMKRVRKVTGPLKESLKRDPSQAFDGILDSVELPYSDRVIGVGDFKFTPLPRATTSTSEMSSLLHQTPDEGNPISTINSSEAQSTAAATPATTGLDSQLATSTNGDQAGGAIACEVHESGEQTAENQKAPSPGKKFLLIETNEESIREHSPLNTAGLTTNSPAATPFEQPRSLREGVSLQPHQEEGLRWLQSCRRASGRQGVLLADDMGLGKTVQILAFLAWTIETAALPDVARSEPPYRPILIVTPLILLENRTWEKEMEAFFNNDGAIFLPTLFLHGTNLAKFRVAKAHGAETDIGKPVLDLDKLQKHRVIFTTYETVRNYQHSFAYVRDGKSLWSAIVSDEAQEYKVPNSKVSHAVKALQADFHIASTGTPVENRLLDLWNLMDTLQPGLLRSAREFKVSFEDPIETADRERCLTTLKESLLVGRPDAFLLRREKSQVTTLPKKTIVKMQCEMSTAEKNLHMGLLRELQNQKEPSRYLMVLGKFARMYQHPSLLESDGEDLSPEDLKLRSGKLQRVIDELHRIRGLQQKAIIFARHRAVQSILAKVLEAEFGIPVRIINGATTRQSSGTENVGGAKTRAAILEAYQEKSGFNVIVLSPFVAGIGLTIVEANHVFHFGRWWNPAVESQATDRVYRIGQTKDVFVYLPILTDSTGKVPATFDERLDALMERKFALAMDFLKPLPAENSMGEELCADLLREARL